MDIHAYYNKELVDKVLKEIVGRRREVEAIVAALAAGKNILLEGPPGTSKSTILRIISKKCGRPFYLVEGSSDLTPQKLIGIFDPAKVLSEGFKPECFDPGPLTLAMEKGGILYIEEFNRLPEEVANVLITAAEERELNIARYGVVRANPLFRIICAMNPYDDVGTRQVSRALLDRFIRLKMDYQSREEEIEIVRKRTKVNQYKLIELAVDIARETRLHPAIKMGASVRGAIDMVLILKEMKALKGELSVKDVETAALMSFTSKIWLKDLSLTPEDVIKDILKKVLLGKPSSLGLKEERNFWKDEGCLKGFCECTSIEDILKFSRIAPRRAALMVNTSPDVLDKISEMGVKGLEVIARIIGYLDPRLKEVARRYARELIIKQTAYISRGLDGTVKSKDPWNYVDLDLDSTIEKVLESGLKTLDNLVVYKKVRESRSYAIILDKSSSMSGLKIVIGALVASIIAYAYSKVDDYLVLAFDDKVTIVKELGKRVSVEELVDRILSLKPSGYTDINLALRKAYNEMVRKGRKPRGILITDGEWTKGENPLKSSRLFYTLHVICVPSRWVGFARMLADTGNGNFIFMDSLSNIQDYLSLLFS